ncbi:YaaL family protein [Sinanaerobacter sp. ZZT-01]|uniref:YaaL family protein n=1 Tax=Sinanaerobacter sp. ZZT-01 TaxID=3111540 RepID=UPI002D76AD86|nr:YaaL family protein [Sinanaerobacter sp. ZZT-01]WRR92189.1 YaaL family protein [Sinanaerobacter sp. ZZT-01]
MWKNFINLPQPVTEESKLVSSINKAQRDWRDAESRFNEAVDADLIDQAIYDMLAARTKYGYLMKLAKEKGLHC